MKSAAFFLGANSEGGFYSLYPEWTGLCRRVWYLKGGPGCGKSGFMRTLAAGMEEAGIPCERIYCSGDPGSLDGVRFPDGTAYVDATAPHVLEPGVPGAAGRYLDLGAFYDEGALERIRGELAEATTRYKREYAAGYDYLAAAGRLWRRAGEALAEPGFLAGADRRAERIAAREFFSHGPIETATGEEVRERRAFLSALTGRGVLTLWDTVKTMTPKIYAVDDRLGLGHLLLERLRRQARAAGRPVIVCPSPLLPDRTEHLLLPEEGVAFLTLGAAEEPPEEPFRRLRPETMADPALLREQREEIRRRRRLRDDLTGEACRRFGAAAALHDELEALYNPHVDFAGVYELARRHLGRLLDRVGKT